MGDVSWEPPGPRVPLAAATFVDDDDVVQVVPCAETYVPLEDPGDPDGEHSYDRYLADYDADREAAWIAYGQSGGDPRSPGWWADFEDWAHYYGNDHPFVDSYEWDDLESRGY